MLRADAAFYRHDVVAAAGRSGGRFSITARVDSAVRNAIAAIHWGCLYSARLSERSASGYPVTGGLWLDPR